MLKIYPVETEQDIDMGFKEIAPYAYFSAKNMVFMELKLV